MSAGSVTKLLHKGARIAAMLLFASVIILGLWQMKRVLSSYFGPSEKTLSETGFDWQAAAAGTMANTNRFEPSYPLWSDGSAKYRYMQMPTGARIDNSRMDRWNFPEGTRLWKVFERDDTYVETRMLYKTGPEPWQWDMAVYAPRADESDSDKLALSRTNVAETDHDIPSPSDCMSCHGDGNNRRPLGLTAVQLPWTGEDVLSMTKMTELGLLARPVRESVRIPGDDLTRSVLGYLDTNCGSCHHEGSTYVTDKVPLRLNLTTETLGRVEDTNAYRTSVRRKPYLDGLGTHLYVDPGDPEQSFLYRRMNRRDGGTWQMPPIASEKVDKAGAELVRRWILGL